MLAQFLSQYWIVILLIILGLLVLSFVLIAGLAAVSDHSDFDDEEQMQFLNEWRKRKEGTKK